MVEKQANRSMVGREEMALNQSGRCRLDRTDSVVRRQTADASRLLRPVVTSNVTVCSPSPPQRPYRLESIDNPIVAPTLVVSGAV